MMKKRVVKTLFVVLVSGIFQASVAKNVNIKNMSNKNINIKWAHFGSSWGGTGRPLVIDEFILGAGEQRQVDNKPYNYRDVTYLPDKDYLAQNKPLSASDQQKLKEKGLETHNLVVTSADGKKKAEFFPNDEAGAGKAIQALPEKGQDEPATGLFLKELVNAQYSLKIVTPEGEENYEATVSYQ